MKRKTAGRSHVILRFEGTPGAEVIADLGRRGAAVLQFVPDEGLLVSIADGADLEGLGVVSRGRLPVASKLSTTIRLWREERRRLVLQPEPGYYVVETFPDVERAQLRSVAEEEGLEVFEPAGLLPAHLVVRASPERLLSLAAWDEVAYVFPASGDLVAGRRLVACPGAVTAAGRVGQYIASVGDGWDGPGLGSAFLGYFFERLTTKLPADATRGQFLQAMGEWAKYASLSFGPAATPSAARTFNILFAVGNHGDAYPFDGLGRVLAHTFYPAPPNPEPIAGDMHFDDDEEWVIGPDLTVHSIDLYSVALHELGHALGLGHSDTPGAVMYPYYRRVTGLTAEDAAAIQQLYAKPDSAPAPLNVQILDPPSFPVTTTAASIDLSGTVRGGAGNVSVSWTTSTGAAGLATGGRDWTVMALPLSVGTVAVTLTAADSAANQVSRSVYITRTEVQTPPEVRITAPVTGTAYRTTAATVTLAGTASCSSGIARVEWANSRGGSGAARGTTSWTAGPIALLTGSNEIRVAAYSTAGASASRTLLVTYDPPLPVADTTPPSLKIVAPSTTLVSTRSASIRVSGTASDNVGVTRVTWTTSTEKTGTAAGTTSWAADVPLLVGSNTVVIRAYDAAGNAAWRSVTVTRK